MEKLWGNCAFPQNFHTRKLGEITVFYAVDIAVFESISYTKIQILSSEVYSQSR